LSEFRFLRFYVLLSARLIPIRVAIVFISNQVLVVAIKVLENF